MNYLVAVSGGIDSVVLLDMLVRAGKYELVVAHFDHGIRSDSAADARFVRELAAMYGLPFVSRREELGAQASEELARTQRYAFLRHEAKKHEAVIVTAHHQDDCLETICINLVRGTGWRGLAVFGSKEVARPLLSLTKKELLAYATLHRLEWVEDSTNGEDRYLRNRIRHLLASGLSAKDKRKVLDLWQAQRKLQPEIEGEITQWVESSGEYSRYFFTAIDDVSGQELLRGAINDRAGTSPTRPQIERALLAIKTARLGSSLEVGGGVKLLFAKGTFIVETP